MLSCPSESYFFALRGVSDEAKPVLITGRRNGTLELWLTAKLDHMKGQQSVKKRVVLVSGGELRVPRCVLPGTCCIFLPVPFHIVHLQAQISREGQKFMLEL